MHKLNQSDLDILKNAENIVDGIATMYGKHSEVLLHSLDARNPSIIKIFNGHITGRAVGSSIANTRELMKFSDVQSVCGPDFSRTSAGQILRSINMVIYNSQQQAIGLLCISSVVKTSKYQRIEQFVKPYIIHCSRYFQQFASKL